MNKKIKKHSFDFNHFISWLISCFNLSYFNKFVTTLFFCLTFFKLFLSTFLEKSFKTVQIPKKMTSNRTNRIYIFYSCSQFKRASKWFPLSFSKQTKIAHSQHSVFLGFFENHFNLLPLPLS